MIQAVLFDLGGVLYVGDRPLPGAREALQSLRAAAVPVRFITNTTRLPRARIAAKLARMGLEAPVSDIFTPAMAAHAYLTTHRLTPHLLVHPNLREEFADLITGEPNAVLVGDAGDDFTYTALNAAFRLLMAGQPLLALGKNRYFRENDEMSLDVGPFVAALEFAANTRAVILGKPSRDFFLSAVNSLALSPEQVVMIGDDAVSDVGGALAAGLRGILVRTGKYLPGDEARIAEQGALVCDDIDEAIDHLL